MTNSAPPWGGACLPEGTDCSYQYNRYHLLAGRGKASLPMQVPYRPHARQHSVSDSVSPPWASLRPAATAPPPCRYSPATAVQVQPSYSPAPPCTLPRLVAAARTHVAAAGRRHHTGTAGPQRRRHHWSAAKSALRRTPARRRALLLLLLLSPRRPAPAMTPPRSALRSARRLAAGQPSGGPAMPSSDARSEAACPAVGGPWPSRDPHNCRPGQHHTVPRGMGARDGGGLRGASLSCRAAPAQGTATAKRCRTSVLISRACIDRTSPRRVHVPRAVQHVHRTPYSSSI